jgi:predicted transcriptional regulator of viral defense system
MRKNGKYLLDELQRKAKRIFTNKEAEDILGASSVATLLVLHRLKKKQEIVTITQGLYAILEPSERKHGIRLFPIIDAIMKFKKLPYYVGLLSGADFYGATHHKPMVLQVMIDRRTTFRKSKQLRLDFHHKKAFPDFGIEKKKLPSGYVNLSSPALTALDVISYAYACGGFDNVSQVIHDLKEKITKKDLVKCCKKYGDIQTVQRLGLLLEYFGYPQNNLEPIKTWINAKNPNFVNLVISPKKQGPKNDSWRIIRNEKIGVEI